MQKPTQPQLAPAMAQALLLAQHPDLPRLFWSLSPDGHLSGSLHRADVDARAVMARYVEVLGGSPREYRHVNEDGTEGFSTVLVAAWRGVEFCLSAGCDAAVVDLPGQLAEQRHQFLDLDPDLAAKWADTPVAVPAVAA